ncbi:MAG: VOC family protein [Roseiflexaceae bacterium]
MTHTPSSAPQANPPWIGFHHIALVTPDLDATITFYTEVLGMQLTQQFPATERSGRHCFIKPGDTSAWGLHLFEDPHATIFPYPETMPRFTIVPGALQHIAFALPDHHAAVARRERLTQFGITPTPFTTIGAIQNMLFHDNNGLLLEATWPNA